MGVPIFQALLSIGVWAACLIVMIYLISATEFVATTDNYISSVSSYTDQALQRFSLHRLNLVGQRFLGGYDYLRHRQCHCHVVLFPRARTGTRDAYCPLLQNDLQILLRVTGYRSPVDCNSTVPSTDSGVLQKAG